LRTTKQIFYIQLFDYVTLNYWVWETQILLAICHG